MNNSETQLVLNNNEEFVNNVKQWVNLDTQLKMVNEKTKMMRETKNELNHKICAFVNENNMNNKQIEISDGALKFYKRKEHKPLSFGYIEKTLGEIIQNKQHVEYIMNYIKENREVIIHDDIRRSYTK